MLSPGSLDEYGSQGRGLYSLDEELSSPAVNQISQIFERCVEAPRANGQQVRRRLAGFGELYPSAMAEILAAPASSTAVLPADAAGGGSSDRAHPSDEPGPRVRPQA